MQLSGAGFDGVGRGDATAAGEGDDVQYVFFFLEVGGGDDLVISR